ncbi:MAG: hypothetical protein GY866_33730 [Proteobacteria bacterium]|nr:hypothetical protein [Pseudomonadota bacterium]
MDRKVFYQGVRFLHEKGLNLFAVLDYAALPREMAGRLSRPETPSDENLRLVMVGNGGRRFWETFRANRPNSPHPVDTYSVSMVEAFLDFCSERPTVIHLFPQSFDVPLQKLGKLAGWGRPSPLGQDVGPSYGVWYAYRSVFLTDLDLPLVSEKQREPPCETCRTRDCYDACPSGAVKGVGRFDVSACTRFRLLDSSPCGYECAARLSCPFASRHRYCSEQLRYHYGFSLDALRKHMKP